MNWGTLAIKWDTFWGIVIKVGANKFFLNKIGTLSYKRGYLFFIKLGTLVINCKLDTI